MILNFRNKYPDTKNAAFIAESADIIGDVTFGNDSSVWFGAVIRCESGKITIGERSNIQDNCTLHGDSEYPVTIGNDVTVGHNAVVHGCTVGDGTLIGMSATVMSGARIGKRCIIGAGALVTENREFPDGSLILGVPAKKVGDIDEARAKDIIKNAAEYVEHAKLYAKEKRKSCDNNR